MSGLPLEVLEACKSLRVAAFSRVGLKLGDQRVQAGHFCLHLCTQHCVHLLQEG